MTSRFFCAAAVAGATILGSGSAFAAGDTQAAWEGFLTITSSTSACSSIGGLGKKDTHVSIFRPHITGADTPTFLSILLLRAALTFQNTSEATIHQMNGAGNYMGYAISGRGKGSTWTTGATYDLTVTPSSVAANTSTVSVSGTINNVFNTTGCSVTFDAVYVKRAD